MPWCERVVTPNFTEIGFMVFFNVGAIYTHVVKIFNLKAKIKLPKKYICPKVVTQTDIFCWCETVVT